MVPLHDRPVPLLVTTSLSCAHTVPISQSSSEVHTTFVSGTPSSPQPIAPTMSALIHSAIATRSIRVHIPFTSLRSRTIVFALFAFVVLEKYSMFLTGLGEQRNDFFRLANRSAVYSHVG